MNQQSLITEIEILPLTDREPVKVIYEIRNYLAGQAHGITRDTALLEEIIKVYFCLKFSEKMTISTDDVETAKQIRHSFQQIKKRFNKFYTDDDEILLDPKTISFVVKALKHIENSDKRKIDVVSHLYEVFIGEDIKGKDGQFFTPKVAVDFLVDAVSPQKNWKIADTACGSCSFLCSSALYISATNGDDSLKHVDLVGLDKDSKLVRLAKIHLALLTGNNEVDVRCEDSLKDFKSDVFDLVITNPPFGAKIVAATGETLKAYDLAHKWILNKVDNTFSITKELSTNTPPQVLFMERNIRSLKPGGILATVVPESLISSKNYKYVIQYLQDTCFIDAVFGMPESLFKISGKGGTHTKTSLLILRKKGRTTDKQSYPIFMAEAQWCGHDSRGNSIPKNDLPTILVNYKKYKNGEKFQQSQKSYLLELDDIDDFTLAPRYYDLEFKDNLEKIKHKCDLITFGDLVNQAIVSISTGDEVGKLAYGGGDIPYVRTSDISNWEIKEDVKQNVSNEVYDSLKTKQDVREGDILLVKDGTYLIGTLGFITKADTKIVYQSHVYKIRVLENTLGLDAYNFLALLSSDFVQKQIRNKVLTQDIIDSLGRRIYDIHIPLPHNKETLGTISTETKKVIDMKEKVKVSLRKLSIDTYF